MTIDSIAERTDCDRRGRARWGVGKIFPTTKIARMSINLPFHVRFGGSLELNLDKVKIYVVYIYTFHAYFLRHIIRHKIVFVIFSVFIENIRFRIVFCCCLYVCM